MVPIDTLALAETCFLVEQTINILMQSINIVNLVNMLPLVERSKYA